MPARSAIARIIEARAQVTSLRNPAAWLLDILGGSETKAGTRVSEKTALSVGAVWACIRNLSEDIGSLPLVTYERIRREDGRTARRRAEDLPLYSVLHDMPNPEMDAAKFFSTLQGHIEGWGNAWAEMELDPRSGDIVALWPLLPDRTTLFREKGRLWVRTRIKRQDDREFVLPYELVYHVTSFSSDGLIGLPPIRTHRESIGLTVALEETAARFFGNNAVPPHVLTHKKEMSDPAMARLTKDLKEMFGGLENRHRMAILEEDMDIKSIGLPFDDAQFIESRGFQRAETAMIFRMPPHKIGDLTHATFCLPADTEVYTEAGPRRIADVRADTYVWSLGEDGRFIQARVVRSAMTGTDPILTIRTTNRTVRANWHHRVLARRQIHVPARSLIGGAGYGPDRYEVEWRTEWTAAGDLRIGDTILVLHGLPAEGTDVAPTRRVNERFMELCGLIVSDGNVYPKRGFAIARSKDAAYMDRCRQTIRGSFTRHGGSAVHLSEGLRSTRVSSVTAARELAILGLSGTARTKRVPEWIFRLDAGLRLAFLRGFLDGDGSVDKMGRISFSSCSRALLTQIRHLCMGLGIPVTNLRCQVGQTKLPNGKIVAFSQWVFTCSDPGANRRIGSNTPIYVTRLQHGRPFARKGRAYPRFGGRGFTSETCELSRIIAIDAGTAEEVYDLEVEGTHSFVADGVVVHNSNIEHQAIEYVTDSIRPRAVRWERAAYAKLFTPEERQRYYVRFSIDALLRGDAISRFQAHEIAMRSGLRNADEIRALEDENPIEGSKHGQTYYVPLNWMPATGEPLEDEGEPTPGRGREGRSRAARRRIARAYRRVMADAFGRVLRRERADVLREAERILRRAGVTELLEWLVGFYQEHADYAERTLAPVFLALAEAVGGEAAAEVGLSETMTPEFEAFARAYARTVAVEHCAAQAAALRPVIEQSTDALAALRDQFDSWERDAPAAFAERACTAAANAFAAEVYRLAGARVGEPI